jgi:hypothetical protein
VSESYVIAELSPKESGGFAPRGAVRELWKTRDFETIVAGPAETGKTWGSLQYVDALLWKYPGAQGVMCRKTYASLVGSAIRTYLRIIGPNSPIKTYGGEKPQWFDYPNGSRLWVAGLDNPGKALSSERDFFYFNQAEELLVGDWETCMTRTTGRGAVMPYTRMLGDANPGPPNHWIIQRRDAGLMRVLESRHEDNPTLYDDAGRITPQGTKSLAILDALTGVRKQRLRFGKWAAAEGAVYENFDRMYLVREVVRTKQTINFWVETARELQAEFGVEAFACDPAEPSYIMQMQQAGVQAVAGFNDIEAGIDAVRRRLERAGDNRPRLFICNDSLRERDEQMEAEKLPIGLPAEMDAYTYPKGQDGKPIKETPIDRDNHSCDAARYAVTYVDRMSGNLTLDFGLMPLATSGTFED